MKYNRVNQRIENFQKKFDEFENKHYLEIQDYKEFKKENFSNVDKFSNIVQKIWSFIATLVIFLYCDVYDWTTSLFSVYCIKIDLFPFF